MAAKPKKSIHPVPLPIAAVPFAAPQLPTLGYDAFSAFGRENIAAAVKANAAFSAGIEAIGEEMMVYARSSLQSASETARSLLGAKTFEDVVRLQTELARRHFEGLLAGSAKLSELGAALASEAFAPWEDRVEAAMAQLTSPSSGKARAA